MLNSVEFQSPLNFSIFLFQSKEVKKIVKIALVSIAIIGAAFAVLAFATPLSSVAVLAVGVGVTSLVLVSAIGLIVKRFLDNKQTLENINKKKDEVIERTEICKISNVVKKLNKKSPSLAIEDYENKKKARSDLNIIVSNQSEKAVVDIISNSDVSIHDLDGSIASNINVVIAVVEKDIKNLFCLPNDVYLNDSFWRHEGILIKYIMNLNFDNLECQHSIRQPFPQYHPLDFMDAFEKKIHEPDCDRSDLINKFGFFLSSRVRFNSNVVFDTESGECITREIEDLKEIIRRFNLLIDSEKDGSEINSKILSGLCAAIMEIAFAYNSIGSTLVSNETINLIRPTLEKLKNLEGHFEKSLSDDLDFLLNSSCWDQEEMGGNS